MKLTFEKASWIWENTAPKPDEYAEFKCVFAADAKKKQYLSISADSDYTVYVNGALAAFGQYHDYPHFKVGDKVDISGFVYGGKNDIRVVVWYYGKSNMSYSVGHAGVIFEVTENEKVVAFSSPDTPSRIAAGYVSHKCVDITEQLGLSYEYDATSAKGEFSPSVAADGISCDITLRPIKKTVLRERTTFKKAFGGTYRFINPTGALSPDMQKAALTFIRADRSEGWGTPFELRSDNGENVYFIIDLAREECGFLDFDITVPEACDVFIAYGEHLEDGRVRTHKRNFTCVYHAKAGKNTFMNTFRRFGCRYLEFFVASKEVRVDYAGIRPVEYPLNVKKPDTGSVLRDAIYETSERTLSLCMHEHYEDCPWREQALYAMDSRNQMLFGYYAFGEYEFARASLYLMSQGQREKDGLLDICFPTDNKLTIPSFSLMYFIEMREYIVYSGDTSLAEECYHVLTVLAKAFLSRIDSTGLCPSFYSDDGDYWGFYEWSETLDGVFGETKKRYECPLNACLSIALWNMAKISHFLGFTSDEKYYLEKTRKLNAAIRRNFWNEKDKLFVSFSDGEKEKYSVFVNSACVLCGAADEVDKSVIETILYSNGDGDTGLYVIPITLSMHVMRYDAMLHLDKTCGDFILDDIDRTYLYMLRHGATACWETIKGERDFDWVGSLCHGWAALPIYYYETLIKKGKK